VSHVPFLPPAEDEFLHDVAGYEAERLGLGAEFVSEVERAVRRIAFFPQHGSPYLGGTRRVVLRRFPYSIVYLADQGDLLVVAVAHHRRKPGYWRTRLSRPGA
jgi:toxin ParE1/3/4